jgi:carbon-monoxide dehydrogenase large subunit
LGAFGKRQQRVEDDALLTGRGRYIDDIQPPGALHVAIVRSPLAHGRIRSIDAAAVKRAAGVVAVVTAEDLPERARWMADGHPNPVLKYTRGPAVLAQAVVRYVGEPVAAVVASDRYLAEDAAELVEVDYESLPAAGDPEPAAQPSAPLVHADMPSNVGARIPVATGDIGKAFQDAACIVSAQLEIHRGAGQAMETRGMLAQWDEAAQRMVVWHVSQVPYVHRAAIAHALGLDEAAVQVRSPDVGGGFGYKGLTYAEDVLVPVLARMLGRPVKWIEDRREHLICAYHERSQFHDMEMALDAGGKILGMRGRFHHDSGAYSPWGPVVPLLTAVNIPGPYKVPSYAVEGLFVYTHRTPVAPVRGAGRPQAVWVMERLLDAAARKLKMDPAELRFRNLIQKHEYPYDVGFVSRDGTRRTYDSGDVPALLRRAIELVRYEDRRKEQAELRRQGRYIGLGMACCVEDSGLGPYEEVTLTIEADGSATARMGTPSQGQGQRTSFAQVVADELGLPVERVKVVAGDTELIRHSIGTFASRAGIVTGSAMFNAARELRARALEFGSRLLQARPEELTLADGAVRAVADAGRAVSLAEIVAVSRGSSGAPLQFRDLGPGMTATASFSPKTNAFPTGAHAAVVEVDPDTFKVSILQYVAVEDIGTMINPMIVDGQMLGGIAHGVGNSLLERVQYDDEGQILTGTFADYLMPTTMDVPRVELDYLPTPSPLNPLGMKGAGQGGTIPVPATIAGAVEDALAPFGVRIDRAPFSESDLLDWTEQAAAS